MRMKEIFYDWGGANLDLFRLINALHSPGYDQAMTIVTQLGNHHLFKYYFLAIAACAAATIIVRKLTGVFGIKAQARYWLGVLLVFALGYALDGVLVYWAKGYFSYPRPYVLLPPGDAVVPTGLPEAIERYRGFPSGHASFATVMMGSLWPMLIGWQRLFAIGAVILVCWSRVALGMHTPADVLWSALAALAVVYLTRAVCYRLLRIPR